tara:strand:- start:586 stop:840 length:255 start_codon:yes stop_codon:yes gene_type:complete
MLDIKVLMNTKTGKTVISILLGLGLASIFRKACKHKNCHVFTKIEDKKVDNKIFKFNGECHQFNLEQTTCDKNKQTIQSYHTTD